MLYPCCSMLLLHRCCTARMKFRGSVDCNCSSLCSGWHTHSFRMAHPRNTITRSHRNTVRSCPETKTLKYGYYHNVKSLRCYTAHSRAAGSRTKLKESKKARLAPLFLRLSVFMIHTAVGSYSDTHARTRTLTNRQQKHRTGL